MQGSPTPQPPSGSRGPAAPAWSAVVSGLEARARRLAGALARGRSGKERHPTSGGAAGEEAEIDPEAEALALVQGLAELTQLAGTGAVGPGSPCGGAPDPRALGLAVVRAQEEERRRMAREMHDGPAQLLANVVLRIDVCLRLLDQDTDTGRLRQELSQLKELVRLSLQDVRKVIFDLRPLALDDLGLVPALNAYVKDYQARTGVEVELRGSGADRRFDPALELAVFRTVQEALTNVARHSGASRVRLSVDVQESELRVTIQDNGSGFDVSALGRRADRSFGLAGMAERARLVGGHLEVESEIGKGTSIRLVVPVPEGAGPAEEGRE